MSYIAWGASKLLELYVRNNSRHGVELCIDSHSEKKELLGIPIVRPNEVNLRNTDKQIVIFAVSSTGVQAIFSILSRLGLKYLGDFILYSDLFFEGFKAKVNMSFGIDVADDLLRKYTAFVLNSKKPHHTTILGTVLIATLLDDVLHRQVAGDVLEVGAFEGGNALALLTLQSRLSARHYYILDSFEGFPQISNKDPQNFGAGDYATGTPVEEIVNGFKTFGNATVIKGFVPATFAHLSETQRYSVVFYDCDLYQPAIDTFQYAWDKLSTGGYMVVHDYCVQEGGFDGVRQAVDSYFGKLTVQVIPFFENTMAVIKKAH